LEHASILRATSGEIATLKVGRRDWDRTSDPHHVNAAAIGEEARRVHSIQRIEIPGTNPRAEWPLSWPLIHRMRGDGGGRVVTVRRAPQPAEPPGPPTPKPAEPRGTVQRVLDVAAKILQ
jgi:hypothetical protein